MKAARPKIFELFAAAYRDLFLALEKLRPLVVVALGALAAQVFAGTMVPKLITSSPVGQVVYTLLIDIFAAWLLTPFLLAVHRLIVLGEVVADYKFETQTLRFRLLFAWFVALVLARTIPDFFIAISRPNAAPTPEVALSPFLLVTLAAMVALLIFTIRVAILFPAVASDAPGATWQSAAKDTKGHFWFIFGAWSLPVIPLAVLVLIVAGFISTIKLAWLAALVSAASFATIGLAAAIIGASVASRIYLALGDNLNRPLPD